MFFLNCCCDNRANCDFDFENNKYVEFFASESVVVRNKINKNKTKKVVRTNDVKKTITKFACDDNNELNKRENK